jgi:hypothetical protein
MPTPIVSLLPVLLGCKSLQPAPTDLDELAHFFLAEFAQEDDNRLQEGSDNIARWYDTQGSAEGATGTVSTVQPAGLEAMGLASDLDMSSLVGVFELITHPKCSVSDIDQIYVFEDQQLLFNDPYDAYERTYDTDVGCFLSGECAELSWTITITDSMLGKSMTYDLLVELRRLTSGALLVRSWMPEPAVLEDGDESVTFFDQSYHIEVFSPRSSGSSLHFYAMWNSGGLQGVDTTGDFWINQHLSGLQDWNDRLDELCVADRGLWQ